jgi:hypothetical protein
MSQSHADRFAQTNIWDIDPVYLGKRIKIFILQRQMMKEAGKLRVRVQTLHQRTCQNILNRQILHPLLLPLDIR